MMNTSPVDTTLGEELFNRGWRQGSLFTGEGISFTCNEIGPDGTIVPRARKISSDDRLVIVSQECDIVAAKEPYVEALLCKAETNFSEIGLNSARRFVVDPKTYLVAEAEHRITVSKKVLVLLNPQTWPDTEERLQRFVRWLGRRFTRPAIDEAIVTAFQKPALRAIKRFKRKTPIVWDAFGRAVHEVRIKLPPSEQKPYDIQILLLIADELSIEEADSIEVVMEAIRSELDPTQVTMGPEYIATKDEISLRTYLDTTLIFLDDYTYKGNDAEGAEPFEQF